jgi:hypothetical protein
MTWNPSNQPGEYNEARVQQLEPIAQALINLKLPPIRQRKLNPIFNALAMQVEDGGDNPEVNRLLLDALRAGVLHQVDAQQAETMLHAIEAFATEEKAYWEKIQKKVHTANPSKPSNHKNRKGRR